jgi:competence protein ComEC
MTQWLALAMLAGSLAALAMPPPYLACALLAGALLGALTALAHIHEWRAVARCGLALLAGFALTTVRTAGQIGDRWPAQRDGERVLAVARIVSIPVAETHGMSFDAELALNERAERRHLRARVLSRVPSVRPDVGDTWQLVVALRSPRARLNPAGPDMERVWFRDGVAALGTVVPSRLNRRVATGGAPLDALRAAVANAIHAGPYEADAAALMAALAVGVTGAMSTEQWRVFNATGTTHLVAISGLHVTLFAVIAVAAARRLWRFVPAVRGMPTREPFAAALGLAAATAYALLAGFSVPTQRTLLMLAAWHVARRVARARSLLHAMAVALVLVLVLDPLAPLASGFWLSFGAVAAILIVSGTRFERPGRWREAALVQGAVTLAVAPITLAAFGAMSLASLFVNVIAIPVFTCVLVPGVLCATALLPLAPSLAMLGYQAIGHLYAWGWPVLEAAARWPFALVAFEPHFAFYLLAAPALGAALLPWPARLRLTAAAALLPLVYGAPRGPAQGQVVIDAFEAGRGTAVVVRTRRYTLLYGTGESFGTDGRVVARLVIPALHRARIARLDHAIVPRFTHDAAAGIAALALEWPAVRVSARDPAPNAAITISPCSHVAAWRVDGVHFRVDAECRLVATFGARRVEFDRRSLRVLARDAHDAPTLLVGAAREGDADQVIDLARHGATRIEIDSTLSSPQVVSRRDGYPWPWRAPV